MNNWNLPNKKYRVIYADPPWSFKSAKSGGSMNSGAISKYPTVGIKELMTMPVSDIADDDCMLFMWYVSSQPEEAIALCKAWGFTIRNFNGFIWDKLTVKGKKFFGMGFYTRAGAECCIIATKGKPSNLVKDRSVRQVRSAVNEVHSKKPQAFRDDIVKLCGDVPRIELFARNKTEKWDVWGNEV